MSAKFYVDANGNYLGGFDGYQPPDKIVVDPDTGVESTVPQPFVMPPIPAGAVEVPTAPSNGRDRWLNGVWVLALPGVPAAVTMRQARLALLQAGLLPQVEAAVIGAGQAAQIEWEFSNTVERKKGLGLVLAPVLGLSDAQVDDLFRLAATL